MCYVRKMSFISYFQRLAVVKRREWEQRRRLLLAAALLGKKTWAFFLPYKSNWAFVTHWWLPPSRWCCRDRPDGPGKMRITMAWGLRGRLGTLHPPNGTEGAAEPKKQPERVWPAWSIQACFTWLHWWSRLGRTPRYSQRAPASPQLRRQQPCQVLAVTGLCRRADQSAPRRAAPCPVSFIIIFFQITLGPPLRSQLTGRKVEDFHKNLNSSSGLSNNRIWILNLQYIYIYI